MRSRDELVRAFQAAVLTGMQIRDNQIRRAFHMLRRDERTKDEILHEMSALAIQTAAAAQLRAARASALAARVNKRAEQARAKCMFLPCPDWPSCDEMS
jgi:hypothetical protein